MSAHSHREFVEGCYRCDLSRDEAYGAEMVRLNAGEMPIKPRGVMDEHLTPGEVWVSTSDGQETTIISAEPATTWNAWIVHKAKRTTHTMRSNFLRKYRPKEQS